MALVSDLIFKTRLQGDLGKIYEVIFDVKTSGEVDYIRFQNQDGEIVFADEFN